jgi:hypothetical protein
MALLEIMAIRRPRGRDRLSRTALAGEANDVAGAGVETLQIDHAAIAERDAKVTHLELRRPDQRLSTRLGSGTRGDRRRRA